MLNEDFTYLLGNMVHIAAVVAVKAITFIGIIVDLDMRAVGVANIDSRNRYPLSFFYIYYNPIFERSQVKCM